MAAASQVRACRLRPAAARLCCRAAQLRACLARSQPCTARPRRLCRLLTPVCRSRCCLHPLQQGAAGHGGGAPPGQLLGPGALAAAAAAGAQPGYQGQLQRLNRGPAAALLEEQPPQQPPGLPLRPAGGAVAQPPAARGLHIPPLQVAAGGGGGAPPGLLLGPDDVDDLRAAVMAGGIWAPKPGPHPLPAGAQQQQPQAAARAAVPTGTDPLLAWLEEWLITFYPLAWEPLARALRPGFRSCAEARALWENNSAAMWERVSGRGVSAAGVSLGGGHVRGGCMVGVVQEEGTATAHAGAVCTLVAARPSAPPPPRRALRAHTCS